MIIARRFIPPLKAIAHAWDGRYQIKDKEGEADCVVGFSFGYRGKRHVTPGLSNQDLANVALKDHAELPKIFQFEIADAYLKAGGKDADKIIRISKHRVPKKYLDTYEVALQAKEIMERKGYRTALLLAHPYHMPRVQAVATRLGIDWVADADERGAVEFDPLSTQKWTRSLDKWRGYEPLALMYYRLKGWL